MFIYLLENDKYPTAGTLLIYSTSLNIRQFNEKMMLRWYNFEMQKGPSLDWFQQFKPGVPKSWLQFIAGLMWTSVGIFLIYLAGEWIMKPEVNSRWFYLTSGVILAGLIYRFGFSRLAKNNSQRIDQIEADKPCLFAFQEWHSYPLIIFMIFLGISLRKYTPIPKPLLGILYIGIGGGLGSSSMIYYRRLFQKK
jgi:hypothetical protein